MAAPLESNQSHPEFILGTKANGGGATITLQSRRRLYLLPALFAMAACSHVPVATCPAIVPYTQDQQTKAADELDTLPPDAVLRTFMDDYKTERARLRACQ